MPKTILSLFDYSGNWPSFYKENGYDVIQVDLKYDLDILDISANDLPKIYGVLAAPPCTDFSSSGAQYWGAKDADGRTASSLALVDKTLELISTLKPEFWALENPVGRLNKLRPVLGNGWYFQPYWYGDPYTKKTGLWGNFNNNLQRNEVVPSSTSWLMRLGGNTIKTKELRSITPLGFAKAFYEANK